MNLNKKMLQGLLNQAQEAKDLYENKISDFEKKFFKYSHANNLVEVEANGKSEILKLNINEQLLETKDLLEELVAEAFNEIIKQISDEKKSIEESAVPKMPF